MEWTKEAIDILIAHRDAGLTSGQIATLLGISRNAVMGKLNRLGLVGGDPSKPKKKNKPIKSPEPVIIVEVEPEPEVIEAPVESILDGSPRTILTIRNGECKWPLGASMDRPRFFCGEPCLGRVYCEHHSKISFQPPKPRQIQERRI